MQSLVVSSMIWVPGTNVDICVIKKGSVDYLRPYDEANVKGVRYV